VSAAPFRLDTLAMTALWTAAARARESRRQDRLFDDPWALVLAGKSTIEGYDRAISHFGTEIADLNAIITRYFDDFLLRATEVEGIRQVVIVGAGLDARAFRLKWAALTQLYELDQPGLIAYKNSCMAAATGAVPACARHTVGVNLNERWQGELRDAGFDPDRRSVWLLEGFLYFLAEPAVRNLLAGMTDLAAPGSRLGMELVNGEMLTAPSTRHWNDLMSAAGAPWLFTSDHPESLLAEFGWSASVVQAGEEDASFGRCSGLAKPRAMSGVPRCFLVTGTRCPSLNARPRRSDELTTTRLGAWP
jgi:methyltransferase (TIGR00027 family)